MGMYCSAVTERSISARPTTEISAALSWPTRMRRTMSISPPWVPSVKTVNVAPAPCAFFQRSAISCMAR